MGGHAWLNACGFDGESSIPLSYRILGPEGSSGSQLVHPAFRELCALPTGVMTVFLIFYRTGSSPVLSPHNSQGQEVFFGLIYSHCQTAAGAPWPSVLSQSPLARQWVQWPPQISGAHLLQVSKQGSYFYSNQILL